MGQIGFLFAGVLAVLIPALPGFGNVVSAVAAVILFFFGMWMAWLCFAQRSGRALVVAVIALVLASPLCGVFRWPLIAGVFLVMGVGRIERQALTIMVPVWVQFQRKVIMRQNRFQRKLAPLLSDGSLNLPGRGAALKRLIDPELGCAYVLNPHDNTLSAVLRVSHEGVENIEPFERDVRSARWGKLLASAKANRIATIQSMVRVTPDSGRAVQEWFEQRSVPGDSLARRIYSVGVAQAGPTGSGRDSLIAVTLDLGLASKEINSKGGGFEGAAQVMRTQLSWCEKQSGDAGLTPAGWLDSEGLALVIRQAYDPTAAVRLEMSDRLGRDIEMAGPVAEFEHTTYVETESGFHRVFWIDEWPENYVSSTFMEPLVNISNLALTVTVLHHPVKKERSLRRIRFQRGAVQGTKENRARRGRLSNADDDQEDTQAQRRDRQIAGGHRESDYIGLVAVSAPTLEALEESSSTVVEASPVGMRLLKWQQSQAFQMAALPLGKKFVRGGQS
ncbi:SCO6880 family protein [Paenarthrobacter sp. NPDC056912]|uniref:SCO6880 family protein n=1 Tax=Paenarthrobacter sp. NPDC056912 TaxID=3345965 RepID=UPI00366DEC3D